MALGRFKKKLKKGCRFLKGGRVSCKTKPRKGGGWQSAKKASGRVVRVSRDKATKANGRLKKGCRFVKGGGTVCRTEAVRRRRRAAKR